MFTRGAIERQGVKDVCARARFVRARLSLSPVGKPREGQVEPLVNLRPKQNLHVCSLD